MNERIALVTGGSRGIGRAIALQLASDGFAVAVNYRSNEKAAEEVKGAIAGAGGKAMTLRFDIADKDGVYAGFDTVARDLGPVDTLINNAAAAKAQLLLRMTDDEWHDVIGTNLNGAFYCTNAMVKGLLGKRRSRRRIVNLTSIGGEMGFPGTCHYAAAKAGLIGMTRALAAELAPLGYTVNAVSPGFIDTDGTDHFNADEMLKHIPIKRKGEPEEVARLVSYLVSEHADYVTGQVIRPNGGALM